MTVARLVTQSRVDIEATAVDVWPHVLEPNTWKQGLKPVRVSGTADALGEVRRAEGEHEGSTVWLATETVVLQAPHRKVVRITSGSDLDPAWAAWQLQEGAGVTTVSYDVYGEVEIGDADPAAYVRLNQERFDAELLGLKALVESG